MTPTPRKKILVLTFTPIASEPRALKQIRSFRERYDVTTAGFGPAPVPDVPHIELDDNPRRLPLIGSSLAFAGLLGVRAHRAAYAVSPRPRNAYRRLSNTDWDLIVAHDVLTTPLAFRLTPRYGVLVDLHEYAPRQNEHSRVWRMLIAPYFRWILRRYVANAAAVTTVSQGIVDEYRTRFTIDSTLVVNATPYQELVPQPVPTPIRLVHSGIPAPARKLEVMIDAVLNTTTDVTLSLFLMNTDQEYYDQLVERAAASPRIVFKDPVPYRDLVGTLNDYDVGLSMIAPTTFNLAWCLPNKFFDFVQARLGVITGPSPEMARYVNEHGFGAVTDDFSSESLTRTLDELTPERVQEWKRAADRATSALSGEEQVAIWDRVLDEALAQPPLR